MFSCSGTHVRALCTQHECAESLKRDPKARIAVNLHVARNMVGGTERLHSIQWFMLQQREKERGWVLVLLLQLRRHPSHFEAQPTHLEQDILRLHCPGQRCRASRHEGLHKHLLVNVLAKVYPNAILFLRRFLWRHERRGRH